MPYEPASRSLGDVLPWMRKRTHKRLHIEQGKAYRREIQEARWDAERARAELQHFVDSLASRIDISRDFPTGNLRISVEIDRRLLVAGSRHDLLVHVCESIMRRLANLDRDYRGDLRQTQTQRALGL